MRKTNRKIILLIAAFVLAIIVASSSFSWFAGVSPVHAAGKTVTAYGNAQIDTAQSKFGGAGGLFDGSGDYLSTPDSSDWYFGTGDFTVDFWVRFNALPIANPMAIVSQWDGTVTGWHIECIGNYYFRFEIWVNNVAQFYFASSQLALSMNTWYHIAVVRYGSTWTFYLNGQNVGSTTNTVSVPDSTGQLWVGENENWRGRYLNGWLDEFRVSKGIARWTSSFTPPAAAYTTDSYTVLLLHMDGADGSTNFIDSSLYSTSQTFNVRAGATKITATITLSSSGTATISLVSPTTTYTEASMTVYEKTSGTQQGTTSYIKRAELPLSSSPTSQQTWSLVVAGAATYQWSIEVT